MDEAKSLLASKTVWAGLIGVAASLFGLTMGAEDQAGLADLAVQIVTAVSGLVAIYGRVKATKRIGA